MIPKIIHACWLGKAKMPDDQVKYIEGWKKLHPDYEVILWTDEMFEKYYDELEDTYTQLGFRITLFSYMLGCKNKKYSYVKNLKREFLLRFPDYKNNKYYAISDKEEEKMINLCMKNSLVFYIYYSLLWKYRRIKK